MNELEKEDVDCSQYEHSNPNAEQIFTDNDHNQSENLESATSESEKSCHNSECKFENHYSGYESEISDTTDSSQMSAISFYGPGFHVKQSPDEVCLIS